jgi:mycofactocin system creatininase family protein
VRLGTRSWRDLAAGPPLRLLVPLGATEQHGPHLPLATDTIIATALAERAAAERPGTAVAPALPYGSSGEHAGFPGTLSIGQAALELTVTEVGRGADGFAGVVLVCWHGGNAEPVARAVQRLRAEGRRVLAWQPAVSGGDAHAGWVETSLMLALAPDLVGAQPWAGVTAPLGALMPALRTGGVRAVSPTGVLGTPQTATAARGRTRLDELTADLVSALDGAP